MRNTSFAVLLVVGVAACASASGGGSGVTVRKSGLVAPAKPAGCALEVLQKPPARPYYPLGEIESHVTAPPPEGAVSVVKPQACELGADAIIVNRNMVLNEVGHVLVSVTAIRWPEANQPAAVSPTAVTTVTPPPSTAVSPSGASTVAPPAPAPEEQHVPLNPREPKR
jgi:hypothetical protein